MKYRIKYWFNHGKNDVVYVQKKVKWWPFWINVTSIWGIDQAKELIKKLQELDKSYKI